MEPRHGDSLDYPDIPGDSGLSDEYLRAGLSDGLKAALAGGKTRREERLALAARKSAERKMR